LSLIAEDAREDSALDREFAALARQVLDGSGPLPYKHFGPYRLLRAIGEGGMGIVYLAERSDLGTQVAIKILRDAWLSPARRERFAAEQRTLAQLNHPFIARLYDADTSSDGTPYFVMEYVEGMPLTRYCDERHCSLDERLRLFHAVCEAVHYAHQHAVIHRDLKPSNILVKADGAVRLLDFGIAKPLASIGAAPERTLTALRLMTPAYASPEQLRGERVGVQTDVYSLGVILYQLLTGRLPFDPAKRTPAQVEGLVATPEPERPSLAGGRSALSAGATQSAVAAGKGEWADLDVLCLTALHADIRRRYSSVEALLRDVDHFLKREPLEARPDTLHYRIGKFVSRHRRSVAAAFVALVVVSALTTALALRLRRERDTADRETAIASEVNRFLADDLLARGDPFQSGKAAETLTGAMRAASPDIDRKFAGNPAIAASLHLTVARAFDSRSDFAGARAEYERAHALLVQIGGPLSQDAIEVALRRAAMEARSFQPKGIAAARSLIEQQERLLGQIRRPRPELAVWLDTAKGMLALVQSDARSANQHFRRAVDEAARLPDFDRNAAYDLRQRLAFTYIRLGDGAQAERLARRLIADYTLADGPLSPYVLRVRLNLAQAYMIERRFADSVAEANAIYPYFVSEFGADHQLTMQLLTTRAQSEGSLGRFDDSVRDDLLIHGIAVKKQGPLSFYAIATLSDASVGECRAHHLAAGERDARAAHDASARGFGPRSVLAQATLLPLSNCLIALGRLDEAAGDLDQIDGRAVAQLAGDPNWGAGITLAKAEIAVRQGRYAQAEQELEAVRPVFSQPDAESYQRSKMEDLSTEVARHLAPHANGGVRHARTAAATSS
jgi:eukaryotic-like serine/threonine-protein kinase